MNGYLADQNIFSGKEDHLAYALCIGISQRAVIKRRNRILSTMKRFWKRFDI